MAIPSSSGMLNRPKFSSPSPVHRERSWIEYLLMKIACVIRAKRVSETSPLSSAERGVKPHQTVAKTIASKNAAYSASKGQLIKTDFAGSSASSPSPKGGRREGSGIKASNPISDALGPTPAGSILPRRAPTQTTVPAVLGYPGSQLDCASTEAPAEPGKSTARFRHRHRY